MKNQGKKIVSLDSQMEEEKVEASFAENDSFKKEVKNPFTSAQFSRADSLINELVGVLLQPKKSHYQIDEIKRILKENYEKGSFLAKIKSDYGGNKPEENNLGFFSNKEKWGNHLKGAQWIKEQKKKQKFHSFEERMYSINSLQELAQIQVIMEEPDSFFNLKDVQESKNHFDVEFPPESKSLVGVGQMKANWKEIQWKRSSSLIPQAEVFQGRIQPQDIKQGILGDCYYLAGMAALAERPDRIVKLFRTKQKNETNYFSVRILFKGKWKVINIDDYFPVKKQKLAFGKSTSPNQLWVSILQKAWAKLYGSYQRIPAGTLQQSLHDLTGAPVQVISLKKSRDNKKQMEKTWKILFDDSLKEYAMACSSNAGSDTKKSANGIVQGHAYTFLNATEIDLGEKKKERIVQLRNPWAHGEWQGKWRDSDPNWKKIDEKEKKRLHYIQGKNDGIFFMPYEDYLKQFSVVTIAQINDNASYIYKSYPDPQKKGVYFRIDIFFKGKYSFHIDKTSKRAFPKNKQKQYNYAPGYLKLRKIDEEPVKQLGYFLSKSRSLYHNFELQPGVYVVWAKMEFDKKIQTDFDVTLGIYGEYFCLLDLATNEEAVHFNRGKAVDWVGRIKQKEEIKKKIEEDQRKRQERRKRVEEERRKKVQEERRKQEEKRKKKEEERIRKMEQEKNKQIIKKIVQKYSPNPQERPKKQKRKKLKVVSHTTTTTQVIKKNSRKVRIKEVDTKTISSYYPQDIEKNIKKEEIIKQTREDYQMGQLVYRETKRNKIQENAHFSRSEIIQDEEMRAAHRKQRKEESMRERSESSDDDIQRILQTSDFMNENVIFQDTTFEEEELFDEQV